MKLTLMIALLIGAALFAGLKQWEWGTTIRYYTLVSADPMVTAVQVEARKSLEQLVAEWNKCFGREGEL